MYKSLKHCVEDLEKHGKLVRIKEEVDPNLEMAEIHFRTYEAQGPALFFEKVTAFLSQWGAFNLGWNDVMYLYLTYEIIIFKCWTITSIRSRITETILQHYSVRICVRGCSDIIRLHKFL